MAQGVARRRVQERRAKSALKYILPAALPAALIAAYYALICSGRADIFDWATERVAAPYREYAAAVTSIGPLRHFSLAEVLLTLFLLWLVVYILRTPLVLVRSPHKLLGLGVRLYALLLVALYIAAAYLWLWGSAYRAASLSEKTGINPRGVTSQQLDRAARLFAERANALAGQVSRDSEGHFLRDTEYYFALSKGVYANIVSELPELGGNWHPPKPMMYSKLMSFLGFSGVYVAFTGEANVNTDIPASLLPATIAHEMAHQRGVASEDEANFAAIAACITSNITAYEYSGYLCGLMYLTEALAEADPDACREILAGLDKNVVRDWTDNAEYWSRFESPAAEAAAAMYDGYLKGNGVESGIASYGKCVDMLVTWLDSRAAP